MGYILEIYKQAASKKYKELEKRHKDYETNTDALWRYGKPIRTGIGVGSLGGALAGGIAGIARSKSPSGALGAAAIGALGGAVAGGVSGHLYRKFTKRNREKYRALAKTLKATSKESDKYYDFLDKMYEARFANVQEFYDFFDLKKSDIPPSVMKDIRETIIAGKMSNRSEDMYKSTTNVNYNLNRDLGR